MFDSFVPHEEFHRTDGPVQFDDDEEDPFGLDEFLTEARKASSKRPTDADRSDKDKSRQAAAAA